MDFKHLTEVTGSVDVYKGTTLTAPKLEQVTGSVDVHPQGTLIAPLLKR